MAGCASVLDDLQPRIHDLAKFYHKVVSTSQGALKSVV
jgi:hypothetical protein